MEHAGWGKAQAHIYRGLLENGRMTIKEITDRTPLSRGSAQKVARRMERNGLLGRYQLETEEAEQKRGPNPYAYYILDDVREERDTPEAFYEKMFTPHIIRLLEGMQEVYA